MRATYTRTQGVRHLLAAYELGEDKLYGHIKPRKNRARFLEFCRYLRSLYPPSTRIAIICDNFLWGAVIRWPAQVLSNVSGANEIGSQWSQRRGTSGQIRRRQAIVSHS
jgi:hypothetical protein